MKQFIKSLYVVALAALAVTACTKEPGNISSRKSVEFSSNFAAPTRVNGSQWEYGDEIGVYMIKDMGVITNPSDIIAGSQNKRFQVRPSGRYNPYDTSQAIFHPLTNEFGDEFDFVAYYPYTADDLMDGFKIPINIANNKPVLTGTGHSVWYDYQDPNVNQQPVKLDFKHEMARIKLNIFPGEGFTDNDLYGLHVSFRNANAEGEFDISTNQFVGDILQKDVSFKIAREGDSATLVIIPNTEDISFREIVFRPRNFSDKPNQEAYDLTYEVPADVRYQAGKEHVYNVTLHRTVAEIEVAEIEDWLPEPELEVPGEIESIDQRKLRLSVYAPNSYVWPAKAKTPVVGEKYEFQVPILKAFGMWKHDPDLIASGIGEIPEDALLKTEIIWADNKDIERYTFTFNTLKEDEPKHRSILNIAYNNSDHVTSQFAEPMNMLIGLRVGEMVGDEPVYEDGYRWSWHIWVVNQTRNPMTTDVVEHDHDGIRDGKIITNENDPEYDENDPGKRYKTIDYTFMNRNLGAVINTKGANNSMGLYYQWGRPTPFIGVTDFTGATYTKLYSVNDEGEAVEITTVNYGLMGIEAGPVAEIKDAVLNPQTFFTGATGWITDAYSDKLWDDEKKSPWDPCPDGWRVPAFMNKEDPTNPMSPWNNPIPFDPPIIETDPERYATAAFSNGYDFNIEKVIAEDKDGYKLGWYPAAGYRDANTGEITDVGINGIYHSSSILIPNTAPSRFRFNDSQILTKDIAAGSANANNVRCVKIQ